MSTCLRLHSNNWHQNRILNSKSSNPNIDFYNLKKRYKKEKLNSQLFFFCKYNEFKNPMTVDVGEFFSVSKYNILTGFEPSKSLPLAMIYELRQEEKITEGLWEDLYGQHLC